MNELAGIEGSTRAKLAEILRNSKSIFTVSEVSELLGIPPPTMAKMMARWVEQGWLIRVRRGAYMAVPQGARSPGEVAEDPHLVASRVFEPCYLGGWTAAEQWGLTEQIFRTIIVLTPRKVNARRPKLRSSQFLIRTIPQKQFFGTKIVWRENSKIVFSDPTKTIVDMLNAPGLAGGGRMLLQILTTYLSSKDRNLVLLLEYSKKMGNGAIFKRLGFLLEQATSTDEVFSQQVREHLTAGNAKLDPAVPSEKLVTRWRLFVPKDWGEPTV
ncbi:MAG: type IV toxin-antitoxin system AbiEi family antitoxin domain-containing protein [Bacteroidota bacterium]